MTLRTALSEISHSSYITSMKKTETIAAVFDVLRAHITTGMTIRDIISTIAQSLSLISGPLEYTNEYIEIFVAKCIRRGLLVKTERKIKGSFANGARAGRNVYVMVKS